MPTLTPEAKDALRKTIRGLRERLATDLRAEAESVYRLTRKEAPDLSETSRERRGRLLALADERARSAPDATNARARDAARERVLSSFVLEAAHTLVNRLVLLRHMEALSAGKPRAERLVPIDIVTKGWQSPAYRAWREHAPGLCEDATEGYATLLGVVFEELARDLPGLYGDVGLTCLFPIPAATLREVIEALNDPLLESAWTDDTTLGWVYQYWNDPERERLDAKINDGGKIEPHEIASKTQMFTERYMVEWLLQNSLGLTWLAMCKKHGWRPYAEDVLAELDRRRVEWRAKRDGGEVSLDALMPIHGALEDRWKYWVPQPIPQDAVEKAPASIREVKLLDPACGSGHFLVIAFDLLAALYGEEANHRGETWTATKVAESIIENNLHGVDIDPRAVQIAAAGLYVKWRALAHDARPRRVNLVAPALHLGRLKEDDPAFVQLRRSLAEEAGIPAEVTSKLVKALAGVDHLGSLLKVDRAIDEAIDSSPPPSLEAVQGDIFRGMPAAQGKLALGGARKTVLDRLESFLAHHGAEGELGLRLDGEEVAAGLRFLRIAREDTYSIVIGNPPYSDTSNLADPNPIRQFYPRAKDNLYTAFLERALELTVAGGIAALVTMRGWMFLGAKHGKGFADLRAHLLDAFDLRVIGDFDRGAFADIPDEHVAVALSVIRRAPRSLLGAVAVMPTPLGDTSRDSARTARKRAAVLALAGRFEFQTDAFDVIDGKPLVYWWPRKLLDAYRGSEKLGAIAPVRVGMKTSNNTRFVRRPWELRPSSVAAISVTAAGIPASPWVPYVQGAAGKVWLEPLDEVVAWERSGFAVRVTLEEAYGMPPQCERLYFAPGVAFAPIGSAFTARAHRYRSIFSTTGTSVFPADTASTTCLLNMTRSRFVLESLNPGTHFEVGDVGRLPMVDVPQSGFIFATLERAFTEHETAREVSVEFRQPGASPWAYAKAWAQSAVDRGEGEPVPRYEPTHVVPAANDFVSYAIGVAFGRFGSLGEGVRDSVPRTALPHGILFVSSLSDDDSLADAACAPIHAAWAEHSATIAPRDDLRTWLRTKFFAEHKHKTRYDGRPIYFPLSSKDKNFVAWISIHRWQHDTLQVLLANHLKREETRLVGQLADLTRTRASGAKKGDAERRYRDAQKFLDELQAFIASVRAIAERGPPPTADGCPPREADARFLMDLDDGVMVNAAALWTLLDPQWKDPKKWWRELATAQGRKDYDWSHLAARYFPSRVEKKCQEDPSLAVAHRCFWRLHPTKAYAWELRLQDEIRPDFTIDEPGSDDARTAFLRDHPNEAEAAVRAEAARRARKKAKAEAGAQMEMGEGEEPDDEPEDAHVEEGADA